MAMRQGQNEGIQQAATQAKSLFENGSWKTVLWDWRIRRCQTLTDAFVQTVSQRYIALYEKVTGMAFEG